MVCKWRVEDTVSFTEQKLRQKKEKEESVPRVQKIGRLMSRLLIIAVVGYLVFPRIESFYKD